MASGPGVSAKEINDGSGRWRVRWREAVTCVVDADELARLRERATKASPTIWDFAVVEETPEGSRVRYREQREKVVSDEAGAVALRAKVLSAVERGEVYEPKAREVEAPRKVAALHSVLDGWRDAKAGEGKAASSITRYRVACNLIKRTAAEITGRPEDRIPAPMMTRDLLVKMTAAWRERELSDQTIYTAARIALEAWTWGADDPATYPGLPTPPRAYKLPDPPQYEAPPAPTLAECDAAIRHIHSHGRIARACAIVMRYTGLRVSQVLGAQRGDLDVVNATLLVRLGKSKRERSARRTIPVSRHMIAEIAPYLGTDADGPMIARRGDTKGKIWQYHPDDTLYDAWDAATKAGEARREVWEPPQDVRKLARPDHAFRAAFQDALVGLGVRDEVIDALVGHAAKSTRGRHYSGPAALAEAMRAAVDALPAIDWAPREAQAGNVIALTR